MSTTEDAAGWSCRSCGTALTHVFVDLGTAPPCEAFLTAAQSFPL